MKKAMAPLFMVALVVVFFFTDLNITFKHGIENLVGGSGLLSTALFVVIIIVVAWLAWSLLQRVFGSVEQ